MAFSRFFGRGREAAPAPGSSEPADDTQQEAGAGDDVEVGDVLPETPPDRSWRERADAALPTGASTGSKRAAALWGDDAPPDLPTHFASARGCRVVDAEGNEYLDCTMALGSVALGYAEPRVTHAVQTAAAEGNVSALSSWREVELAERLRVMIPCAERVQVLKSGAEAVAAAVRIARTYTSRERVVASGYFGWHDWASEGRGVPRGVSADTLRVPFDDVAALERAVAEAGAGLAAVVLEPVVERLPSEAWLRRARELCDASGAVLVFDEIKTGFRVAPAGYQEVCGITPDIATFGKALANGYPVSAVVGHAALMDAARETWISSTLASESTALAAALAVLDWHDEADICATLAETGRELRAALDHAIAASGVSGVETDGTDSMFLLRWDDPVRESQFVQEGARAGVLFKRGAYNFSAVAHDDEALREIEAGASVALVALAELDRNR
ncbi:MAG TPA: aminotransferase class III-fold pyridoxal phosphate-dependent enzyme [Gemmatimonadaceae bacterium]|nr:aminotransferase class III-fold pyridoxal phosphate-dependent enzyme [Gemmatimonadaceae bacterium]